MFLSLIAALIATFMLFWIIGSIFIGGLESLTWYFLTTAESETPHIGMGILNAIVGTLLLSTCATFLATPFAFCTAIYLTRYAKDTWYVRSLRFFIEVLSGTPSIVLGMFGFLVFVYYLKYFTGGFSLLAGSIALAILIMPVIERATEDAINTVGNDLEEGSYALGSTKWQTIRGITIPVALSGIITGTILGFGRAAEESAVVILTAGYTQYMPYMAVKSNPDLMFGIKFYPFQHVIASLPYSVYHAYENSNVIPLSNGFAAAFVLICFVLVINILAKTILWYGTKGKKRSTSPFLTSLKRAVFRDNGSSSITRNIPAGTSDAGLSGQKCLELRNQPSRPAASSPPWTLALTQPIEPASPSPSIDSGENPHVIPPEKSSHTIPLDGELIADDIPPSSRVPGEQATGTPLSDLFEDEPSLLSDSVNGDAIMPGDDLLTEDLPRAPPRDILMEDALDCPDRLSLVPGKEDWENMTINRQENTHV
jgi:phosphate transport system permease protein